MNFSRIFGALLTLACFVCVGTTAAKASTTPTPYSSYTVLSKPHKSNITATGINSSGQVVGVYTDSNQVQHGFVLTHGAYTKVDVPGALTGMTAPSGINEYGVVVGSYQDSASYGERGFVFYNGVYTTFAVNLANADLDTTFAQGINDWGQIVGSYEDHDGTFRGFVLTNGVYKSFDIHVADPTMRVNATLPAGINDLGQITGSYTSDINGDPLTAATHGFILSGGALTTLDVPGAINVSEGQGTQATGINAQGQVCGVFTDAAGTHGFVYRGGTSYITLNAPNSVNTYANGINSLGQVAGYYDSGVFSDVSGEIFYGFVVNP